jgi:hypothetical protein
MPVPILLLPPRHEGGIRRSTCGSPPSPGPAEQVLFRCTASHFREQPRSGEETGRNGGCLMTTNNPGSRTTNTRKRPEGLPNPQPPHQTTEDVEHAAPRSNMPMSGRDVLLTMLLPHE